MRSAALLSGGIDSAALTFWLQPEVTIFVDYGQIPSIAEEQAATQIAEEIGTEHHTIHVDCRILGSGDLAGSHSIEASPSPEWWPFRNQLLITLAAMRAISIQVDRLLVGSVASDGFHKDGTLQFFELADGLMSFQEGSLRVAAPAITMTTEELIDASEVPVSILGWTHSCHSSNFPCGRCRGCNKHLNIRNLIGF